MLIPIVLLALALRLLPIIKSSLSTFGYDYGFYLHALKNSSALSWDNFLAAVTGGYGNPLFFPLSRLPWSPEASLSALHFLLALALPVACYFFFVNQNKTAALFAAFFAAISVPQFEAYRMFLLKTIIAVPFLILAFKFLREKKYPEFLVCSLVIFLIHRTTLIVYLLTVLLYFVYKLIREKRFVGLALGLAVAVAAAALARPYFEPLIQNFFSLSNANIRTGIFFPDQNIALLLLPMLALAAWGLIVYLKRRENAILPIFGAVSLLWIVFELPFYRRVWVYFDLALILLAAYGLGHLKFESKKMKGALVLLLLLSSVSSIIFIRLANPLITPADLRQIKNFEAAGNVLALSAADYPWLLGFGQKNRELFAPGFYPDPHSLSEWLGFWSGQNQNGFFMSYPKPLYIYQRSYKIANPGECLERVSENFLRFAC